MHMKYSAMIPLALALAAATVLAICCPEAMAQERSGDPLGKLAHCFDDGEFRVASMDRLPENKRFREVATVAGTAQVSTADGYRMLLHQRSKAPLVNLKLEKSADGRFEQDRGAVLAHMELFSDSRTDNAQGLEVTTRDGVEVMALNKPRIDAGGPLSFYSFAHQRSGTIGTAYILSQPEAVREFKTYDEYTSLRDRFVGKLVRCMAQQDGTPKG